MSTSTTQFSEADVDIRNTKKTKKNNKKWMSTSATLLSEADVKIHSGNKSKF